MSPWGGRSIFALAPLGKHSPGKPTCHLIGKEFFPGTGEKLHPSQQASQSWPSGVPPYHWSHPLSTPPGLSSFLGKILVAPVLCPPISGSPTSLGAWASCCVRSYALSLCSPEGPPRGWDGAWAQSSPGLSGSVVVVFF